MRDFNFNDTNAANVAGVQPIPELFPETFGATKSLPRKALR